MRRYPTINNDISGRRIAAEDDGGLRQNATAVSGIKLQQNKTKTDSGLRQNTTAEYNGKRR